MNAVKRWACRVVMVVALPSAATASVGPETEAQRPNADVDRARQSAGVDDCKRLSGSLPAGSMALDLVGSYRVQFVGTAGRARGKRVTGTLTLKALDAEAERVPVVPQAEPSMQLVLSGALVADLDSLRVMVPGREKAEGARRALMLVRQYDFLSRKRPSTEIEFVVQYRNRGPELLQLDGAHFGMLAQRIDAGGFRGTFSSTVGMTTTRADGHFCAWRVPDSDA